MFKCAGCSQDFEAKRRRKFCSHSCSARHSQLGQPSHNSKVQRNGCLHCGEVVTRVHGIFCNKKCEFAFIDAEKRQGAERWVRGGICPVWQPKAVSRLLKKLRGSACELCGWNEIHRVTGLVPTQVEHVDGDCTNNSYTNLKILCPNCHSLTPTFGALNKGRSTRKRYQYAPVG